MFKAKPSQPQVAADAAMSNPSASDGEIDDLLAALARWEEQFQAVLDAMARDFPGLIEPIAARVPDEENPFDRGSTSARIARFFAGRPLLLACLPKTELGRKLSLHISVAVSEMAASGNKG